MFYIFNVLFSIIFFCILGLIIYNIAKNISTWNQNNHSEKLTVPVKIVAKRTQVSQHQQPNAGDPSGAHGFTVMFFARPFCIKLQKLFVGRCSCIL